MKRNWFVLIAAGLFILTLCSSTFAIKITHTHIDGVLVRTAVPVAGSWKCKVSPPFHGNLWAGFDYMDTLYGYVESQNSIARCGAQVNASTAYVFKSAADGLAPNETCRAEAWTADEVPSPYCPPPFGQ